MSGPGVTPDVAMHGIQGGSRGRQLLFFVVTE